MFFAVIIITMNIIHRISKVGLVAIIASVLSTVEAGPKKGKEKPDKPHPEKKIDREKVKERLKAAFDKRKKRRGDAKKKGSDIRSKGRAWGKLVRNDEKIKELKKDFEKASEKIKLGFDKSKWKDSTDEQKEALREKMRAARKEWEVLAKKHREEVRKRMIEIRKEFANKRDKVIDGNKPGE